MDQKGFALIVILMAAAIVIILGGGAYYLSQKSNLISTPVIITPSPSAIFNTPLGIPTASPSAAPSTSSSSLPNRKICTSDKDCGPNQHCVAPGPVAVDPSQNKKYCWNDNEAVPL